ncbi:MAG: hypothetical protein ABII23_08905 [bacterium]
MYFNKIISMLIMLILAAPHGILYSETVSFKDASPKLKNAAGEFDERGILKEFISKYGAQYFRPTTTVTREDLLLALHEYDLVVKTLLNYRSQLGKSMVDLKKRVDTFEKKAGPDKTAQIDNKQIDSIAKEIQNRLPMLLNTSPIPKQIEDKFQDLNDKIDNIEVNSSKSNDSSDMSSSQIKKLVQKEVKRILEKESSVTTAQINNIDSSSTQKTSSNKLLSKLTISLGMLAAIFLAR